MLYKKILSGFVSLSFFVNPYYSYGGVGTKDSEQDPLEYSDYIITSNIQSSMLASTSSTELSLSSAQQQLIAAADNGDVLMQFEVALNFARGRRGFPYDIEKGINYLRLASSGKYIPAMFEYASLLENGSTGVEKNYSEAAKTYLNIVSVPVKKDKLQGFAYFVAMACYRLGLIYDNEEHQELGLNLTTGSSTKEAKLYYKKGLKTLKQTDAPNKELFKGDFLYMLGREKELSNKHFTGKVRKHHPLIQANLLTNDRYTYDGLSNNPNSSRAALDKLQKKILKSQEQLTRNSYIALLKDTKEGAQSQFLQQLVRCYSRMSRSSKSFEAQKKLIIDKATAILRGQLELMKIYGPTQENQQEDKQKDKRRKLLQLHEDYVINQLVFNRITQGFTRSYEEYNEEKSANNFEDINKYLDDLAKGNLKSANLKLLRYYGRTDELENSFKIVERIIPSYVDPSQTNEAKTSVINDIDLTNISKEEDLKDLLDAVSADNTVTGLILQQKNLSEITGLLNQVLTGNHNLTRLDLSGNQITSTQLQTLVKNLKQHPNLRELILDNNLLRDEGVSLLLPVIRKNLTLGLLSLSNNEISQLGGAMLFGALAQVRMREDASFKLMLLGNEAQKLFNQEGIKNILSSRILVNSDNAITISKELPKTKDSLEVNNPSENLLIAPPAESASLPTKPVVVAAQEDNDYDNWPEEKIFEFMRGIKESPFERELPQAVIERLERICDQIIEDKEYSSGYKYNEHFDLLIQRLQKLFPDDYSINTSKTITDYEELSKDSWQKAYTEIKIARFWIEKNSYHTSTIKIDQEILPYQLLDVFLRNFLKRRYDLTINYNTKENWDIEPTLKICEIIAKYSTSPPPDNNSRILRLRNIDFLSVKNAVKMRGILEKNKNFVPNLYFYYLPIGQKLKNEDIIEDCMIEIIKGFGSNQYMSIVYLHNCYLHNKGVIELADFIKNKRIEHILLPYNKISYQGVIALVNAININMSNIICLDLSYNKITDKGVSALANTLKIKGPLHIKLTKNKITDEGAINLLEYYQKVLNNGYGKTLDLSLNPITFKTFEWLFKNIDKYNSHTGPDCSSCITLSVSEEAFSLNELYTIASLRDNFEKTKPQYRNFVLCNLREKEYYRR